jgi:hypothetical protein
MAINSSSRNGQRGRLIVIHSAEGSRTVESLYAFFNGGVAASSHGGADGYKLADGWVPDERAAWTLLNGNPYSFNLELCGFASWSRAEWLSEGWVWNPQRTGQVWNPRQMIRHAALWVVRKRDAAKRLWGIDIPIDRKLSPNEVGAGKAGLCGHADYTYGTGDGDHTDPGPNVPWDVLIADIKAITGGGSGGGGEEEDMARILGGEWEAGQSVKHTLTFPSAGDKNTVFGLAVGWEDAQVEACIFIGAAKVYLQDLGSFTLPKDHRHWFTLPHGTDQISLITSSANPIAYSIEFF